MMFRQYNANPKQHKGDDCTVRAISLATDQPWNKVYLQLCAYGMIHYDMPSANHVWGHYLRDHGWKRNLVDEDPEYTVSDFAKDNPKGKYILALHGHVVTVIDGDYYDSWDSGNEIPIYYWQEAV